MSYFFTTFNVLATAFLNISKQLHEVEASSSIQEVESSVGKKDIQKTYDEAVGNITSAIGRSTDAIAKFTEDEKRAKTIVKETSTAILKEITETNV